MKFTEIRDLKYVMEDKSRIDLLATCEEYGEIPMTLILTDTEDLHVFATGTFDEDENEILIPLEEYCKQQKIAPYVKPEPVVIVPKSITPIQFRLQLNKSGLRQKVDTKVAQSDDFDLKDWLEYSTEYRRDNEILIAFAKELELSDEDVDNFFIAASKLK